MNATVIDTDTVNIDETETVQTVDTTQSVEEPIVNKDSQEPEDQSSGSEERQRTQWKPKYEALKTEYEALKTEKASWQVEKEQLTTKYSLLEKQYNEARESLTSLNAQKEQEHREWLVAQDDAQDMLELLELKYEKIQDKNITFEQFYTEYKDKNPKRFSLNQQAETVDSNVRTIQTVRQQPPIKRPASQEQIMDDKALLSMTKEQYRAWKQDQLNK